MTVPAFGIAALEELRARSQALRRGVPPAPEAPATLRFEHALLDVLGVGMEPTRRGLVRDAVEAEQLEAWLVAQAGGELPEARVRRARALAGVEPRAAAIDERIAAIEAMDPVLGPEELATWERDGVVVLREAVERERCAELEAAIWARLGMDPAQPEGWTVRGGIQQGIMVQLFTEPAQVAMRESPRVHKAFAQLWGTADLLVTTDRCGFNPPERDGFAFPGPFLHWDLSSFDPPIELGIQAILYLTDTAEDQGAFQCVPGFHRRIDAWLAELGDRPRPSGPELDVLGPRPVAASAGDLVIWHHALPHGATPNRSRLPRIVQYLTMYPPPAVPAAALPGR